MSTIEKEAAIALHQNLWSFLMIAELHGIPNANQHALGTLIPLLNRVEQETAFWTTPRRAKDPLDTLPRLKKAAGRPAKEEFDALIVGWSLSDYHFICQQALASYGLKQ